MSFEDLVADLATEASNPYRSYELAGAKTPEEAVDLFRAHVDALIASHGLRASDPGSQVSEAAHLDTQFVLLQLCRDPQRRGDIIRYLADSGLVQARADGVPPAVSLSDVDLWGQVDGTDLTNIDLHGAVLAHSELRWSNLAGANLENSDLSGAWLDGADLSPAWLSGATLRGASLPWAQLQGADLVGADFTNADLRGANLRGADLGDAILVGALLGEVNLSGANLEGVRGLSVDELAQTATYWDARGLEDLGVEPDSRDTPTPRPSQP
jgi:uncharacterized protein YjbI with pentapeptide repeats